MVEKSVESLIYFFVLLTDVFDLRGEWRVASGVHEHHHMKTMIYPALCSRKNVKKISKHPAGTKWCGPGDIARNYDDLGVERVTDSCCREHDQCPEYMEPGQSKYGLTNTASFVRLHCSCDRKFHACLKDNMAKNSSSISKLVGALYFDSISTHCYAEEHSIVGCKEHYIKHSNRCRNYTFDETKALLWQWFDDPSFLED